MIERVNQTLINSLRCKINSNNETRSWSTLIKEVANEYNNSIHSVTKFSPQYLLFGKENIQISPIKKEAISLNEARKMARNNTEEYRIKNKKYVNKNRKDYEFAENDQVFVKLSNKLNRKKLDKIKEGPFRISKILSKNTYKLDTGRKTDENNIYHKNNLVPVKL